MNYLVLTANDWLYPDVAQYPHQSEVIDIFGAKDAEIGVQVFFPHTAAGQKITICAQGVPMPDAYRENDVLITSNSGITFENIDNPPDVSDTTVRKAPYRVYDCLQPFTEGGDVTRGEATALYLSWHTAGAGEVQGKITVTIGEESTEIPVHIRVYNVAMPGEKEWTLSIYNWFSLAQLELQYDAPMHSDKWFDMFVNMLRLMRRTHQSHLPIPMSCIGVEEVEPGKYVFDFTMLDKYIEAGRAAGIPWVAISDLATKDYVDNGDYFLYHQPEGRQIVATSKEGYRLIAQLLPAIGEHMREKGMYDHFLLGIGDEPLEHQANQYRILCGIARKFLPGVKLFNAISTPTLRGALDYAIPLNKDFQEHMDVYDAYRANGDTVWQYTCCGPTGPWLNRLMDQELLRPRLLHWGNYRYALPGYLHWGFNYWTGKGEEAYEHANGIINRGTALLPPGDTHISYPGNENGPWLSIRAEMMRMGCEDYELLCRLARKDKARADAICLKAMRAFDDFEKDTAAFESVYRALLEALEQ